MDANLRNLSVAAVSMGVRTRRHSKRNVWRTSSFRSEENSKTSKRENHQNQLDFIVYFEKWTKKKNFGLTRTIRDGHGFCSALILYILSTVKDQERIYGSCGRIPLWGRSPFQGWAPGRAAEIRFELRRRHFFENFAHLGHHARTYPSVQLFQKRIDRHGTYISG